MSGKMLSVRVAETETKTDCHLMCYSCFVAEAFIPQGNKAEKWQYSKSAQWVTFCKPRSAKRMYQISLLSSFPVDLLSIITIYSQGCGIELCI